MNTSPEVIRIAIQILRSTCQFKQIGPYNQPIIEIQNTLKTIHGNDLTVSEETLTQLKDISDAIGNK
jgi:hypothetical protein